MARVEGSAIHSFDLRGSGPVRAGGSGPLHMVLTWPEGRDMVKSVCDARRKAASGGKRKYAARASTARLSAAAGIRPDPTEAILRLAAEGRWPPEKMCSGAACTEEGAKAPSAVRVT